MKSEEAFLRGEGHVERAELNEASRSRAAFKLVHTVVPIRKAGWRRQNAQLFEIEEVPEATIVYVRGELDVATHDAFQCVLTRARAGNIERIIISLEGCRFMDCSAFTALLNVRASGVAVYVVMQRESYLRRLFEITNLTETFHVVDSVQSARAAHPPFSDRDRDQPLTSVTPGSNVLRRSEGGVGGDAQW